MRLIATTNLCAYAVRCGGSHLEARCASPLLAEASGEKAY